MLNGKILRLVFIFTNLRLIGELAVKLVNRILEER